MCVSFNILGAVKIPTPQQAPPSASDVTREDLLDAVNQGLRSFDFSDIHSSALVTKPLTKADVSDAVKQQCDLTIVANHILLFEICHQFAEARRFIPGVLSPD